MGGQKNTGFVWTPTKRRGPIAAEFSTPGPAAIGLPSTFGTNAQVKSRSPAFTISGRFDPKSSTASPGPGQYNINGLSYKGPGTYSEAIVDKYKAVKSPAFSMGQRTNIPSDHTRKPGPGAHSPEKCMQDDGPKWSMAKKLEELKQLNVPGPGSYEAADLDGFLEKQPVYSMRPKTELPIDKTPKPSPNAYNPEKYNPDDGPKWTLSQRLAEFKRLNVPGPGTYEAADLDGILEKQPVYSMRPKTELPKDKTPKPSPNAYNPEKYYADDGPKWTLAQRLAEFKRLNVPGPGTYEATDLDDFLEKRPVYSMRPKTELPTDKGPRPSPNAYNVEKCMPDDAPKWTMAPRTELPTDKTPKPGPNAYDPDEAASAHRNPEFSFGIKHSQYLGQLRDQ